MLFIRNSKLNDGKSSMPTEYSKAGQRGRSILNKAQDIHHIGNPPVIFSQAFRYCPFYVPALMNALNLFLHFSLEDNI